MVARCLEVTVGSTSGLKDSKSTTKSDPYAVLRLGSQQHRTHTSCSQISRPVWNHRFSFLLPEDGQGPMDLHVQFWDKADAGDRILGSCKLNLSPVFADGHLDVMQPVHRRNGKLLGHVRLHLSLLVESSPPSPPRPRSNSASRSAAGAAAEREASEAATVSPSPARLGPSAAALAGQGSAGGGGAVRGGGGGRGGSPAASSIRSYLPTGSAVSPLPLRLRSPDADINDGRFSSPAQPAREHSALSGMSGSALGGGGGGGGALSRSPCPSSLSAPAAPFPLSSLAASSHHQAQQQPRPSSVSSSTSAALSAAIAAAAASAAAGNPLDANTRKLLARLLGSRLGSAAGGLSGGLAGLARGSGGGNGVMEGSRSTDALASVLEGGGAGGVAHSGLLGALDLQRRTSGGGGSGVGGIGAAGGQALGGSGRDGLREGGSASVGASISASASGSGAPRRVLGGGIDAGVLAALLKAGGVSALSGIAHRQSVSGSAIFIMPSPLMSPTLLFSPLFPTSGADTIFSPATPFFHSSFAPTPSARRHARSLGAIPEGLAEGGGGGGGRGGKGGNGDGDAGGDGGDDGGDDGGGAGGAPFSPIVAGSREGEEDSFVQGHDGEGHDGEGHNGEGHDEEGMVGNLRSGGCSNEGQSSGGDARNIAGGTEADGCSDGWRQGDEAAAAAAPAAGGGGRASGGNGGNGDVRESAGNGCTPVEGSGGVAGEEAGEAEGGAGNRHKDGMCVGERGTDHPMAGAGGDGGCVERSEGVPGWRGQPQAHSMLIATTSCSPGLCFSQVPCIMGNAVCQSRSMPCHHPSFPQESVLLHASLLHSTTPGLRSAIFH
ncbi:unnamed protein product [Closterium sp. Yama58-4]|nr:unnamed protein product [Closterium sp. Yama58-4]